MTLPVIFLMGPTATGKTDIAAALFKRLPIELISVDSALVYRGMDIGTAKPSCLPIQDRSRRVDHASPANQYFWPAIQVVA